MAELELAIFLPSLTVAGIIAMDQQVCLSQGSSLFTCSWWDREGLPLSFYSIMASEGVWFDRYPSPCFFWSPLLLPRGWTGTVCLSVLLSPLRLLSGFSLCQSDRMCGLADGHGPPPLLLLQMLLPHLWKSRETIKLRSGRDRDPLLATLMVPTSAYCDQHR